MFTVKILLKLTSLDIARRLEVGIVGINEWRPLKAEIPFGGIKESGIGVEGGVEVIHLSKNR